MAIGIRVRRWRERQNTANLFSLTTLMSTDRSTTPHRLDHDVSQARASVGAHSAARVGRANGSLLVVASSPWSHTYRARQET
jgi:hypothetical protein